MSILIKGMEMPKEGTVITIYKLNGQFYASVHGTELCPLILVPPHGDLIDRRDLKNKEITIDYDEWDDTFDDGLLFVTNLIDNAPTIIEAEESE